MAEASRLTVLDAPPAPHAERVAAHNFRRLGQGMLITNDSGDSAMVTEADYRRYLQGAVTAEEPLGRELISKGFMRNHLDFGFMASAAVERHLLAWKGPNVHTVVVTRRCNFKCTYCHASVLSENAEGADMTPETAAAAVDLIFQSPSPTLMIEFQGGEPLLNWPVVKFVVDYARKKNAHHKRALHFGLISNFSLLDEEKIGWLAERGVSFCTSLDGPADLHDKNRVYLGGEGHAKVIAGIKAIQARRAAGAKIDSPNAICTVTRQSFGRHREIIDQLVQLGIERVQLGPLDPIGFARKSWKTVGYTSKEFVSFYADALDHVISLSRAGAKIYEKMALILLIRILRGGHWRFPNADGLARLAYDWDGSVYSSEEGRLLAAEGDGFFRLGDVRTPYAELLEAPLVRAGLLASRSDSQPQCFQCAHNPFCSVLPVYNHRTQDSLWGHMPTNGWCEKMMGLLDVVFSRLQDPESRRVLESWLDYQDR